MLIINLQLQVSKKENIYTYFIIQVGNTVLIKITSVITNIILLLNAWNKQNIARTEKTSGPKCYKSGESLQHDANNTNRGLRKRSKGDKRRGAVREAAGLTLVQRR